MATDVEALMLRIEASATKLEKDMAKVNRIADAGMKRVEQRAQKMAQEVQSQFSFDVSKIMPDFSGAAKNAASTIATSFSVGMVVKYADEWQNAGNALAAAGVESEKLASTQSLVADISTRSRTDIASVAELYARMTRSSKDFGASQAEVAVATETVVKGLKLSGATTAEAAAAALQLSQALQSGRLGGDELRSLLEGAPLIAKAVADEFGVTIGELKALGAAGQLSASRVFKALVNSADQVDASFKTTKATVADAFTQMETSAIRWVGTSSAVAVATSGVKASLEAVAKNIDVLSAGAIAFGTVVASRMIGQGLTPLVSSLGRSVASGIAFSGNLNLVNAALLTTVARANAGALAMSGLSGALGLVGGPVGAAFLALGAATYLVAQRTAEAQERARVYAAALEEVRQKATSSAGAIDEHSNAVIRASKAQAGEQTNSMSKGLKAASDDMSAYREQIIQTLTVNADLALQIMKPDVRTALMDLAKSFDGSAESAARVKNKLYELANSNPNFQGIADAIAPLVDKLLGAEAHADSLRGKLAAIPAAVDAATAKAIEAKIPNPMANTTWDQVAAGPTNDPIIRGLEGQAKIQRAVADAEMNETAKKIRDTKKKLVDEILAGGGTVDAAAAENAARRIVAAEQAKKDAKKGETADEKAYDHAIRKTQEETAAIDAEIVVVDKSTAEKDKAKKVQELLTAAKRADKELTPQLMAEIEKEASAHAAATAALEKANEARQASIELQKFAGESLAGFFSDIVSGGKNAEDALMNMTKKLADAGLQAALLGEGPLATLFGTKVSGGGVGGLIGTLFKGLGFADGGYTGSGGKYQPAGIVHRGEYVFDAAATRRFGVANLEAMRRFGRTPGYAEGGLVGAASLRLPSPSMARRENPVAVTYAPTIDARGADAAAVTRLEAALAADRRTRTAEIVAAVNDARSRGRIR